MRAVEREVGNGNCMETHSQDGWRVVNKVDLLDFKGDHFRPCCLLQQPNLFTICGKKVEIFLMGRVGCEVQLVILMSNRKTPVEFEIIK